MRKLWLIIFILALSVIIPISIIWISFKLITGLNPFLGVIITPFFIALATFLFWLIYKVFKKYIRFTPAVLFAISSCCFLILICALQIGYGNSIINIHLHDTYFLISYSYPFLFVSIVFAMFAAIYQWFYKIFKRHLKNVLGYFHFWLSLISTCFLILQIPYVQLLGMPRRYYDFSDSQNINPLYPQGIFIAIAAVLLLIAQLLFVVNFCISIFKKKMDGNY